MNRARIILAAADGSTRSEIAAEFRSDWHTVSRWCQQFNEHGLAGLEDAPRSGAPRREVSSRIREAIVSVTLTERPPNGRQAWSVAALARRIPCSPNDVRKVWSEYDLHPAAQTWRLGVDDWYEKGQGVAGMAFQPGLAILAICIGSRASRLPPAVKEPLRELRHELAETAADTLLPQILSIVGTERSRPEPGVIREELPLLQRTVETFRGITPSTATLHLAIHCQTEQLSAFREMANGADNIVLHPIPDPDIWLRFTQLWITELPPWDPTTVADSLWTWRNRSTARRPHLWTWTAARTDLTKRPVTTARRRLSRLEKHQIHNGLVRRRPQALREAVGSRSSFRLMTNHVREIAKARAERLDPLEVLNITRTDVTAGLTLVADMLNAVPALELYALEQALDRGRQYPDDVEFGAHLGITTPRGVHKWAQRLREGTPSKSRPRDLIAHHRDRSPDSSIILAELEQLADQRGALARDQDDETFQVTADDPFDGIRALIDTNRYVVPLDRRRGELVDVLRILNNLRRPLERQLDTWTDLGAELGMTNAELAAPLGRYDARTASSLRRARKQRLFPYGALQSFDEKTASPGNSPVVSEILQEAHELAGTLLNYLPSEEEITDSDLADSVSMLTDAVHEGDIIAGRISWLHAVTTLPTEFRALPLFESNNEFRAAVQQASRIKERLNSARNVG